ncbi:Dehydroquinate synthase-like protein [Sarocladium strictum]
MSPDASGFRRTMNALPAQLKAADTTTTSTTTVTSASPCPPSHSSGSPVVITTRSYSGSPSTASLSRSQQHKNKRISLTSSIESGGSAHDSTRIVFGPGKITTLPFELARLQLKKPLIVSSPSRIALARRIQALIPNLVSRILDSAVVNVPTKVVDDAVARISGHDVVISVGAGSAIGLAKAVSIRKGIPHVCIPTTYSGSEMSPLLAADGRKMGHKGSKVMPTIVIYDEDLTGSSSTTKRFSAPSAASSAAAVQRSSHDDDASWSYIHLPGV